VRGLYESHARPLTRIVHGLPTSWDPSAATARFSGPVEAAAWSPCGRSIAISWGHYPPTVEILDAATLVRLSILEFTVLDVGSDHRLIFSPDGRLLTWYGSDNTGQLGMVISWDVQTGVLVSVISTERQGGAHSPIAYSACGTMFGVFTCGGSDTTINTYNAFSGKRISAHLVEGEISREMWTHGERLRFATMTSGSVTVWEAGFTSTHAPTEVETLSIPDCCHTSDILLAHPTLPRLALVCEGRVRVWDTQDSRFLLDPAHVVQVEWISFSPDGRFFACNNSTPEGRSEGIYLWKESHTGYVLHRKLISNFSAEIPLFSPNGGSVVSFGVHVIQLWHTMESTTSPSAISAQTSQGSSRDFVLRFSPDEALAAVVREEDETITVLDLKSGIPRLIIDAGMEVFCMGVTGSSIVVVGGERIVTWNLPAGDRIPNLRVNIADSVRTATLDLGHGVNPLSSVILVSPDLHRIAITESRSGLYKRLYSDLFLYDVPTGQRLGIVITDLGYHSFPVPWFTPDGGEVWCMGDYDADRWKIVEDGKSNVIELEHLGPTKDRPDGSTWRYYRECPATDGQWIFNSSGKRLFWLPPQWRSEERQRIWGSRFIGLLHGGLPEAVILELE